MRVLYVVFNAPPLLSGRARQALLLAETLNYRAGVSVQAISLDYFGTVSPPYPPPLWQRLDVRRAKQVWRSILSVCIRQRIRTVHFHGHGYAVHLTPVLRLLGIRVFLHMSQKGHDDPATLLDGRGSKLQRLALSRLTAWIVQNPDDLIPNCHPPLVNIPNAVAPPLPHQGKQGQRNIILSGVICPRKGQLEAMRLVAALPESIRTGLHLRLAGSYNNNYYEYDASYVARCQALAATIPQTTMLGHLGTAELMNELRQAQYFFAISAAEGLSNAYLECLSHGLLPIVYAHRHDSLFDTLRLTDFLIRIPADDPEAGARALAAALAKEPWSEPLARNLRARVAATFGLERVADRLLTLYRSS